jgi:hypothetical protein
MIINDLDFKGIASIPSETDAPLIVDVNTVLTGSITRESLKSVRWRNSKVSKSFCTVKHA